MMAAKTEPSRTRYWTLKQLPSVTAVPERGLRLVGLAADEGPELGFIGVSGFRDVVQVCEEHQVARDRSAEWMWAQVAAALHVRPQAVYRCHAARLGGLPDRGS